MNGKIILGLIALLAFAVLLAGCNYTLSDFQQRQNSSQPDQNADALSIPMPNAESGGESIPNLPI